MVNSLYVYDVIFLVLFILATGIFLYKKRSNLKREGWLFLYPTQIGVRYIDHFAKKHEKILRFTQYIILVSGYTLMLLITYGILRLAFTYLTSPTLASDLKVPVITPLIPYLPELFHLDFLPPFYFTYWIIIIAIVAIPHEFAHGIFARLHKVTVHSTGFGFLGPFLAAFVEPDDKQMQKKSKFAQLSILAAGTFANVLLMVFFIAVIWVFFAAAYHPAGVYVSTYSITEIPSAAVQFPVGISNESFDIEFNYNGQRYITTGAAVNLSQTYNLPTFFAYELTPAVQANLSGAIIEFDGQTMNSYDELRDAIRSKSPGDLVEVKTLDGNHVNDYNVTLANKNGTAFLGVGTIDYNIIKEQINKRSVLSRASFEFYIIVDPVKYEQYHSGTLYSSSIGNFGLFIYNLLWWLILINMSVALMNMLPLGIFDGGRFFMLTVWAITGSKKVAENAFKWSTYFFLLLVALFMIKWVLVIF